MYPRCRVKVPPLSGVVVGYRGCHAQRFSPTFPFAVLRHCPPGDRGALTTVAPPCEPRSPGILNYYTLSPQEKQARKPAKRSDLSKKSVCGWNRPPRASGVRPLATAFFLPVTAVRGSPDPAHRPTEGLPSRATMSAWTDPARAGEGDLRSHSRRGRRPAPSAADHGRDDRGTMKGYCFPMTLMSRVSAVTSWHVSRSARAT